MLLKRKTATLCGASRTCWMYSMVLSTSAPWTCSVATTRWRCISTRARRLLLRHTLGVQLYLTPCHLAWQTPHLLFRDEWRGMLRGLNWHTCLIYLDDIIVFSNTLEEHLKQLRLALNRLRESRSDVATNARRRAQGDANLDQGLCMYIYIYIYIYI